MTLGGCLRQDSRGRGGSATRAARPSRGRRTANVEPAVESVRPSSTPSPLPPRIGPAHLRESDLQHHLLAAATTIQVRHPRPACSVRASSIARSTIPARADRGPTARPPHPPPPHPPPPPPPPPPPRCGQSGGAHLDRLVAQDLPQALSAQFGHVGARPAPRLLAISVPSGPGGVIGGAPRRAAQYIDRAFRQGRDIGDGRVCHADLGEQQEVSRFRPPRPRGSSAQTAWPMVCPSDHSAAKPVLRRRPAGEKRKARPPIRAGAQETHHAHGDPASMNPLLIRCLAHQL